MQTDSFIMMPIPASQFAAVCALLGGASLAAVAVAAPGPSTKPAPTEPSPAPAVAEAAVETVADGTLDAGGWPWDPALHASTKGTTKDGYWRMKVGVSRPDPKPGFPKDAGTTGTTNAGAASAGSGTASTAAAGEDEDEFAAFRAAADKANAGDAAAAASIPARKWSDGDLGVLCNQAAVKLGDPAPVKELIAKYVPDGQVPHSRNIPEDQREAFAQAVEAKADIKFAG